MTGMKNFNILFIIILAISAIMRPNFNLQATLLILPGLVLSLTIHEFAHAKTSDRLGDPTPGMEGRLTLNPLVHMDPVGTAFLLFAGFGWGKPVQVNPRYYRNPARDTMLVSLAGPLSNFILSFLLFLIGTIMEVFINMNSLTTLLIRMIYAGAGISLSLGVFNLIPLPPLDGSKILRYFLRGKAGNFLYYLEQYSMLILLFIFLTDIPAMIILPIINYIGSGMLWVIQLLFKLFGITIII